MNEWCTEPVATYLARAIRSKNNRNLTITMNVGDFKCLMQQDKWESIITCGTDFFFGAAKWHSILHWDITETV